MPMQKEIEISRARTCAYALRSHCRKVMEEPAILALTMVPIVAAL